LSEKKNFAQQEIAPYEDNTQPAEPKSKKSVAYFFSLDATRRVTYLSILIALAIVLKLFGIDLPAGKVSLFYIPCYLAGAFFGPFVGFTTGALGDLIGFIIKGGTPNAIITLGNGLMGFIVGGAFKLFPKLKPEIRLIIGVYISMLVCTLGINTLGLAVMYGSPSFSLWQNYLAQLAFGTVPRVLFQPIVITVNLAITTGLYFVLRKYLAKYLGFSQQKSS
jgi:ECF transporter S component (folate family)